MVIDLALKPAVSRSSIGGLLGGHDGQAVCLRLGSTRGVQSDRDRCHSHGPKRVETSSAVHFNLEGEAASGPVNISQTVRTFDTADGEIDQTEAIGQDPGVGLRPDGHISSIGQSKANVQGCVFQSITVRIAGDSLVSNPIVLLGLGGKNRHQHHCGQEERAHQIHLG